MRPFFLVFIIIFSTVFSGIAQDVDPRISKAVEIFKKGDFDKAIKKVRKVLKKENEEDYWELLIVMYQQRYLTAKENYSQQFSEQLLSALAGASKKKGDQQITISIDDPSERYLQDFLYACFEATHHVRTTLGSQYLRNYLVDTYPDTAVTEKAEEYKDEAEVHFSQGDMKKAEGFYRLAIKESPDYYKATLYLGDTYYHREEYDSAIHYFQKASDMEPGMLEPVKYLTDAYAKSSNYTAALKACWEGIYIYPDEAMFQKLDFILDKMGKSIDRKWMAREYMPNVTYFNQEAIKDKPWDRYRAAKTALKSFCDEEGLITESNDLTSEKYLEVYAWSELLEGDISKHPELKFAKKMKDAGYLDCYVFISMFHHGYYEQYVDFIANNKDRVKEYIDTYLLE